MEEKVPLCLRLWQRLHICLLYTSGLIPFQTWGRITAPIFMLSTTTAIKQFK